MVVSVACISLAYAQDSAVQPDALIQYEQFRSIAAELAGDFRVNQGQHLVVTIESQQRNTAFENILLETLKGRGASSRLLKSVANAEDSLLRVVILDQEIVRSDLGDGVIERKAQLIVDARIETRSGDVPVQKVFRRSATDTLRSSIGMTEMTVFERLLEPAIVIMGAILVVYLLFTVRSS